MEWISVKDRYPEKQCLVLVTTEFDEIIIATYKTDKVNHWFSQDGVFVDKPTYWMLLPEPPKLT